MIRLIYVSRSLSPFPMDLKEILASSRGNNERLDVTGALCFLDGVYLQYLEGEAVTVEDLYRRILSDPRHTDTRLVERRRISERLFKTWAMALVTWNDQTRAIFKAFNGGDHLDLHAIEEATAADTFQALSRSSNWLEVSPQPAGANPA